MPEDDSEAGSDVEGSAAGSGTGPAGKRGSSAMAMAAALEEGPGWLAEAARLRERLDAAVQAAGGEVIARDAPRLPAIAGYRMPGRSATAQLIRFDGLGIAISAGSACSSGSLKASPVLTAMGVDGAGEVIRVSIGCETREEDVNRFIASWQELAGKI